jgi:acyl-coenzyme A thioesterase PaaI-like protein
MATMGFEHDLDDHTAWGRVTMGAYLRSAPRWPGVAALLTFADVLIGRLASQQTTPRISVTADLGVRILAPIPDDGVIEMSAGLLKAGRSMTVGETLFRSASSGDLLATAVGTFMASPRPVDLVPEGGFGVERRFVGIQPSAPTLAEQVGLRVIDAGVVEIGLREDLLNATQSLQGGITSLMGEVAAQTAATDAAGHSHVVQSLEVYYLAAGRVGPFRSSAQVLSPGGPSVQVRVQLTDLGRDARPIALIMAETVTDPGP